MTRDRAKEAAEVMLAYANGKTIECFVDNSIGWVEGRESPKFNWDDFDYRIKGTPSYRPFKDNEECWNEMLKHQPFGWVKHIYSGNPWRICSITRVDITTIYDIRYPEAFSTITFLDGEPFGVKTKNAPEVIFNNIWHNPKEGQPRYHSWFLGQIGDDAYDTFFMEMDNNETWDNWSRGNNIKRWTYIDELLPKDKK